MNNKDNFINTYLGIIFGILILGTVVSASIIETEEISKQLEATNSIVQAFAILKTPVINPMTAKPYHIFVEHITKEDIAYCRKDENCIDIMQIDDLCTREQLGLPTK